MDIETVQMIGRLRRMFSRHADVLRLCSELERLDRVQQPALVKPPTGDKPPKRDRAAYMRDYRKRGSLR
jgi:hypothetical protein